MTAAPLRGKVALVTGGAAGLGRAFARGLALEGAHVAIADIDTTGAEETASLVERSGSNAIVLECDVCDERRVARSVAHCVEHLGGVDILINNAGLHLTKYNRPFNELSPNDTRALFEVNVLGVVHCSVACRDAMRARGGGAIVNISSIGGYHSKTPYGVTKLTVRGLTIAFAHELAGDRIRVNGIAPGLIATDNALADLPEATVTQFKDELQLIRRTGSIDDVVSAMLYLVSDQASFVTGETIKIAGGYPLSI